MSPGFAPAKVNLTLTITGRRSDGYHLLDSLVVFAGIGDLVTAGRADGLSLVLGGPEAAVLAMEVDNLVLRAARALADAADLAPGAALRLEKRLPVASGIGGGSADAAAALRVLNRLWATGMGSQSLRDIAVHLGADVPVCIDSLPARMRGIGEMLGPVPALPSFGLLLANPRVALSTPAVFRARAPGFSPAPAYPASWPDVVALADWLRSQGNDLEAAAIALCPPVAETLAAIAAQPGCRLARMSGSGATCFGLFSTPAEAAAAAGNLPVEWWRWGGATAPATP